MRSKILILITISLLTGAVFLSIYVDGLDVSFLFFLATLLILITAIISFIIGYKHRKEISRWYVQSLIIISMGLIVLFTPISMHLRNLLERNWRWDIRNEVVRDIKSGDLTRFSGIEKHQIDGGYELYYVIVPFEKYGRVSFEEVHGHENAVKVHFKPDAGYMIFFTTYRGFFGSTQQLIYFDDDGVCLPSNRIETHWYTQ